MYVADETGDNFSDVYARIEDFLKNFRAGKKSTTNRLSVSVNQTKLCKLLAAEEEHLSILWLFHNKYGETCLHWQSCIHSRVYLALIYE